MTYWGWQLCYFPAELPNLTVKAPFASPVRDGWDDWLERAAIPARTPFLLSPAFEFDVAINSFFLSEDMIG